MLTKELFHKIRQIEITTSRLVDEALAGEYHSVFKGQGMEYEEVRPYQPGDDVRTIDWNVSSRTGALHIKKYKEERELTVMLLVDASRSTMFGSGDKSKEEVAAEIAALLSFSAIRNNDRVGALLFTGRVEKYIPPRKGVRHVLRLVREVLAFEPERRDTSLAVALEFAGRVLKKRSILFLVSDFFDEGYTDALRIVARRHDVVAVSINDRGEWDLPAAGWVRFADAESGRPALLPTFLPGVRQAHQARMEQLRQRRKQIFQKHRVDHLELWADAPYDKTLVQFFRMRARRARR